MIAMSLIEYLKNKISHLEKELSEQPMILHKELMEVNAKLFNENRKLRRDLGLPPTDYNLLITKNKKNVKNRMD